MCRKTFSLMKVVVAPVSIKIFILYLLTKVVMKISEGLDGFLFILSESPPSLGDSVLRNSGMKKRHDQVDCIVCKK